MICLAHSYCADLMTTWRNPVMINYFQWGFWLFKSIIWVYVNKHCCSWPTKEQKWGRLLDSHSQTAEANHRNDFLLFLLQLLHSGIHTKSWFSLLNSTHGPRSFTKLYRSAQKSMSLLSSSNKTASSHSQWLGLVKQKASDHQSQGNLKPLFRFNTSLPDKSNEISVSRWASVKQ